MSTSLAAQLYTLREYTKTPADIAKTFARVRKMGYEAVQCSALGPIDPKELAKILQNEGLACCATHVKIERLRDEPQAVIDEHAMWGCKYTAVGGYFPGKDEKLTPQNWIDWAKAYNQIAKNFEKSDLRIGYHNHSHELAHYDGKPGLMLLLEHFDSSVWMEIDTYWITHGGGDPSAWIRKVSGRIPCVHLKDMLVSPAREQFMAEVGEGNLEWPYILKACKEAGVQWHIIEQDICYRDPFDSLELSLKHLHEMGMK
jgi:sugar phosphate isomerase/epimerase